MNELSITYVGWYRYLLSINDKNIAMLKYRAITYPKQNCNCKDKIVNAFYFYDKKIDKSILKLFIEKYKDTFIQDNAFYIDGINSNKEDITYFEELFNNKAVYRRDRDGYKIYKIKVNS